ncbi:MAG: hypothetical protein AB7I42_26610 [Bradyrhizobium sp.]|uniref:hypothetical protein n=1 Tax=Bradyrhizobium sp. TaxID=376 RepID=UPI003D149BB8
MKASNVTAENYSAKARAFVDANRGKAFVIAPWRASAKGDTFPATPGSWAAWIAYWRRIGRPTAYTETHGLATVPTEWPHQFDESATLELDTAAADQFRSERAASAERNRNFNVDAAARRAAADHAMQRVRSDQPKRRPTPKEHLLLDLLEEPR